MATHQQPNQLANPQIQNFYALAKQTHVFFLLLLLFLLKKDVLGKFYGQAERPISTGQLRTLLCLHLPPIKVVVFDRPSYAAVAALGDLILG